MYKRQLSSIAVRILWNTAEDAGTIQKVESFIEDLFALEVFEFDSDQILRIFFLGGLILVVGGTALTVVLVVLFNLISDLTGGIRFTLIEEEPAVRRRRFKSNDDIYEDEKNTPTHDNVTLKAASKLMMCPSCESRSVVNEGGCLTCQSCGWSKCD